MPPCQKSHEQNVKAKNDVLRVDAGILAGGGFRGKFIDRPLFKINFPKN